MLSKHRNTVGAIFHKIMLLNIGGSETFEKKQEYFFDQVIEYHKISLQQEVLIKVERSSLLQSVSIDKSDIATYLSFNFSL